MGDLLAPWHIITLVIVGILLFGPQKLPKLGGAAGSMLREFRSAIRGEEHTSIEKEERQE